VLCKESSQFYRASKKINGHIFWYPSLEKKPPKIQDVARAAGVSTATVSRALSQPDMVAEATRQLVIDAVEKTGYRVNLAASNLRRRRTGTIVVMVPNLGNPFFSTILASIEAVAAPAGLGVLIVDTTQHQASRQQVFAYLHRTRADGLIVLDGSLAMELLEIGGEDSGMPPVVFACEWSQDTTFPSVVIDNRYGAELAIRHLHGLGHRRIGHVSGPVGNVLTQSRLQGSQDTLGTLGLEVRDDWFLSGDFSLQSGAEAAVEWLKLEERPTALFCSSDQMACGFISELNRRGYSVPRDMSIVGFDDIEIAVRFIPALTTIRQPRGAIGAAAAEILIDRITRPAEAQAITPRRVMDVELVVRDSTATPPGAKPAIRSASEKLPNPAA
jgi:LacI family repressor for deo operon, udp, cdd, tsx, nupC, and nupG